MLLEANGFNPCSQIILLFNGSGLKILFFMLELWYCYKSNTSTPIYLLVLCFMFNESYESINTRDEVLWKVRLKCTSGVQLTFNCCLHWSTMVFQDTWVTYNLLFRREVVTHGYPLAMILYSR